MKDDISITILKKVRRIDKRRREREEGRATETENNKHIIQYSKHITRLKPKYVTKLVHIHLQGN